LQNNKDLKKLQKHVRMKLVMKNKKLYTAEYTQEARNQILELSKENRIKIISAISAFEQIGTKYKNLNNLGNGLFEIKPSGTRAYFAYDEKRKAIIIIGFVTLKKTQKAPKRYIEQAIKNIENYKRSRSNDRT